MSLEFYCVSSIHSLSATEQPGWGNLLPQDTGPPYPGQLRNIPAGYDAEPREEDDGDGVGCAEQPMVVEGLRYLLTQPVSQGHPQLKSPCCHPGK